MPSSRLALFFLPVVLGSACAMENEFYNKQETPEPNPEDTAPPVEPPSDLPIARCSVSPNPVTPPFEAASWDGSASEDPSGGEIVKYEWALVSQPSGSAVALPTNVPGNGAIINNFVPDLAGDYVGRLVVTNDRGDISDPCEVTLEAIPAEDLWVEMYWTHASDDMDLHLLKPGGQLETNGDCYFANCVNRSLDWGVRGDEDDDPSLDLDDIPGTGPENINILQPEDGEFTVFVHDYYLSNGWGADYTGANQVTVNVYLNGSQVWTNTKPISGDDTVTPFCRINWQAGTVTSM
ncbi:MAG: hypothetical protein ABIO70_01830 [Pseudomonadota bacterium]